MNQRRPHSPATYRRRRLVAALLGVFVLALVVWGARGIIDYFTEDEEPASAAEETEQTQDDDASEPEATAEAESTETQPAENDAEPAEPDAAESDPTEEESTGEESEEPEGSCAAGDVAVSASTNQEAYDAGVAPLLILEIENTGDEECTLDVGTAEQTFAVAHAGREMFNTAQCGTEEESLEVEFEPGQSERAHLVWPRSDSGVDCSEPAQVITGDYELTVSVSGISSEPHTFHLTGVAE